MKRQRALRFISGTYKIAMAQRESRTFGITVRHNKTALDNPSAVLFWRMCFREISARDFQSDKSHTNFLSDVF